MSTQLAETETGTTPTRGLIFTPDTEPNNRLKVVRLAREMHGHDGVVTAKVGTLNWAKSENWNIERREVIEVTYHKERAIAAQAEINVPIAITRAYFHREDGIIAAEFVTTAPSEVGPREIWTETWDGEFINDKTPLTIGDKTYPINVVKDFIEKMLPYDMDQVGKAERILADIHHEQVLRQEHEAKIADAYARRNRDHHWRARRALEEECTLDLDDKQTRIDHRNNVESLTNQLQAAYVDELRAICHQTLGKLRCESDLGRNGDGDPYGFITTGEVAIYILTRWPDENPFGINGNIRKVIAEQFVRDNLR